MTLKQGAKHRGNTIINADWCLQTHPLTDGGKAAMQSANQATGTVGFTVLPKSTLTCGLAERELNL